MYKVMYDFEGNAAYILRERDGANIPFAPLNRDFRKFLEWNKKHKLDWEKSIEVEPIEPVETLDDRIRRIVKEELKK